MGGLRRVGYVLALLALALTLAGPALADDSELVGSYPLQISSSGTVCPEGSTGILEVFGVANGTIDMALNGGRDTLAFDSINRSFSGNYSGATVSGNFVRIGEVINVSITIDFGSCISRAFGSKAAQPVPTVSAGASGGTLQVGISCLTALESTQVACTASAEPRPGGVLSYRWSIDGLDRPETDSTLSFDWASVVDAGRHTVIVTVTDTVNGDFGAAAQSLELGLFLSVTCNYSESGGIFEVSCRATPQGDYAAAALEYSWSYRYASADGRITQGAIPISSERMSRSFGAGTVVITVTGAFQSQRSSPVSATVVINPVGTLTSLLTLGQTSDPQNIIDVLAGSAAVALIVGAGAAIGGALAGAGGVIGGGAVPAGGGSTPRGGGSAPGGGAVPAGGGSAPGGGGVPAPAPGSAPLNAQPMASESAGGGAPGGPTPEVLEAQQFVQELLAPTEGATPSATPPSSTASPSAGATQPTTGSQPSKPATTGTTAAPTSEQVAEGVAEFLSAEAGKVPPPTPDNLEQWRNLSGFPNTPAGNAALQRHLDQLRQLQEKGKKPDTDLFLRMLREQAVELKPPSAPPTPSAPNPDRAYEDATNLLDRTEYEWQHDIDRTKLPFETAPIEPKEPPSGKPPESGKPREKK